MSNPPHPVLCLLPGISSPSSPPHTTSSWNLGAVAVHFGQLLRVAGKWWRQRPVEGVLEDQGRTRLLHLPDSESSTVDVWNQGRYGYLDLSRKVHRLSDIETFFLVWALGVLKVRRSLEDTALYCSSQYLWDTFTQDSKSPSFLERYIAYHHYRSLGWCVRPGTRYGCDYALYPSDLTQHHSSYLVLLLPSSGPDRCFWSLRRIYTTLRVTTQVNKQLVVCWVSLPQDTSSPEKTLTSSTVSDTLLSRWIPEQER
ncbi:MAG: tRNA intron endonuclease [Piptocephalis tieghemiana]|nr:MAG: tRNA intron endonuclease [Piptocephalis tieghemiana]